MAHVTNVHQLPSADETVRRRFRSHVREGREKSRRRLAYRAGAAAAVGVGTALGLRYGAPKLGRLAGVARSSGFDVMEKSGRKIVKDVTGLGRMGEILRSKRGSTLGGIFRGPKRTTVSPGIEQSKEKFAVGVLGYAAGQAGERAARFAGRYPGRLGAATGGAYFGAGSGLDVRRRKRREGELARRLLLM